VQKNEQELSCVKLEFEIIVNSAANNKKHFVQYQAQP